MVDKVLFLCKGSYLMFEKFIDQGVFQSVLFFLDEFFLEQFVCWYVDLLFSFNWASQVLVIWLYIMEFVSQFYYVVLFYFNMFFNEVCCWGFIFKLEELLFNLIVEFENVSFVLFLNGLLQSKFIIVFVMEQNFMFNLLMFVFV